MSVTDKTRTIADVTVTGPCALQLAWSDGTMAQLDLGNIVDDPAFAALCDASNQYRVEVGARCVNGGGIAGRTRAKNENSRMFHG